jgi:DNA-binding MarR family transcriptional regulator
MSIERERIINEIIMQMKNLRPSFMNSKGIFKKAPLFPAQLQIIALIHQNPGIKQSEISSTFHITPSAVTQALNALDKLNFINRKQNAEDHREYNIFLTSIAEKLVDKFVEKQKTHMTELFKCLSDEEVMQLKNIQEKLISNIQNIKCNE